MTPKSSTLWSVKYKVLSTDATCEEALVLASSAAQAETKALRHAKKLWSRRVKINRVERMGVIDVF